MSDSPQKIIYLITDAPEEQRLLLEGLARHNGGARIERLEYSGLDRGAPVFYGAEMPSTAEDSADAASGEVTTPRTGAAMFLIDLTHSGGFEESLALLAAIRGSQRYAETPVLLVGDTGGEGGSDAMIRAFDAGAADFAARTPNLSVELPARIHGAFARQREYTRLSNRADDLDRMTQDLKTANAIFRSISIHDQLTGTPNRRFFDRYLDIAWREAQKKHAPLSLLLIDVDHFKQYNDHYGHVAGDECLQRTARAMEGGMSGDGCVLARYGGEEFAAILPGVDPDRARALAEDLRNAVYSLELEHARAPEYGRVTVSIGAATAAPGLLSRPARLIEKADRALYQAKADGRNRVSA